MKRRYRLTRVIVKRLYLHAGLHLPHKPAWKWMQKKINNFPQSGGFSISDFMLGYVCNILDCVIKKNSLIIQQTTQGQYNE
jgi:hypothetical protein